MKTHVVRAVLCAALLTGLGRAAGAQTPAPVPAPAGFTAHAHANLNVVAQGNTIAGVARFGIAQRGNLVRVDLLSISSDTMPLPPISASAVIDHGARTVTIWNDRTKLYYVQPMSLSFGTSSASPSPSPRPSATPRPSPSPRSSQAPRGPSGSPFRNLEVLSVSLKMTGHTTTAGLPTTGLAFDLQVQSRGDRTPTHVTAATQLADDYAAFPMTIDALVDPAGGTFAAKLGYAVDDIARAVPPASLFTVPAGYTKASSLSEVVFPRRRS